MRLQGNRDNIDSMAGGSQKVLTQVAAAALVSLRMLCEMVALPTSLPL